MSSHYDKLNKELNKIDGEVWSKCAEPARVSYVDFADFFSFGDIEGIVVECLIDEKDSLMRRKRRDE